MVICGCGSLVCVSDAKVMQRLHASSLEKDHSGGLVVLFEI